MLSTMEEPGRRQLPQSGKGRSCGTQAPAQFLIVSEASAVGQNLVEEEECDTLVLRRSEPVEMVLQALAKRCRGVVGHETLRSLSRDMVSSISSGDLGTA